MQTRATLSRCSFLPRRFIRHPVARSSDFSTHQNEGPVIAQFASNDPVEFGRAAEMIGPWVNGVDLNCGCPQSWAMKEGIGCSMMGNPEKVAAMIKEAKQRIGAGKTVSCKIRIHPDLSETVRFIKIVEAAGVDYITIHGRLRNQRSSTPPNFEAIKMLRTQTTLPVLANGDVYTLEDALRITKETGVDGVMAARGLLENPTLFAGYDKTPIEAVSQFIHYAVQGGMRHELVVHHLTEMMGSSTTKRERGGLAVCNDMVDVIDWLDNRCKLERPMV
ncbi:tRNA-dihydrouridine synthase [Aureobasidium subglaciale]|nr:tRNA-dihydrouridine synthase [Aureobasidium subglaciale]KAI5224836.1 tRNA-dihydrouridine synthase [Aureobasidium subglaciale]KAI5227889.1 tRNA-dihydrouridine synthase [Aureobasidium subglaciale]KAI5263570.1 tRNA-dihydrouridine synthase [Aureobasidium subglaciale]